MKRYKPNAVIGTWTLCDCDEKACKRVPVPGKAKRRLPRPKVKRVRRAA